MPYLETVQDLAEALADMLGMYNQRLKFEGLTHQKTRALVAQTGNWDKDHADDCACRRCWSGRMEKRIRAAVANERHLSQARRGVPCDACNEEDGRHLIGCVHTPHAS